MRLYKVHGGVNMAHHKSAATLPIQILPPPDSLVVSLLQHRGAPARPRVKRGDHVLFGQLIGEPVGLGCPIHSPVSGKVTTVAPRVHPSGAFIDAIVIENDGTDTPADPFTSITDPTAVSPEVIRQRIQEAGIVGMGGAMFPTAIKLAPKQPVDTVIVNGCECEPYLTCDHRVMLEHAADIAYGWEALRHAVGATHIIVAVEENKPDAVAELQKYAQQAKNVEVAVVPARFPQGAEGVLIRRVTGRRLRARGLPAEVGCLVHNVATAVAVAQALRDGKPLVERALTVAGGGVAVAANLQVRIGTPISYVLNHVGRRGELREIILGGPMMGQSAPSEDVPVIKGTSAVLAFGPAEVPRFTDGVCLRCGRCVDACPERLAPFHMARLAEFGRWQEAEEAGVMYCCECGTCTYTCPGRRPLVQWMRVAKGEILKAQARERARAQATGGAAQ